MTQALRDRLGKPFIVRSAYRSPEHKRAVDGATRSKHFDGAAFDIAMTNQDPVAFEAAARTVGFLGFALLEKTPAGYVQQSPWPTVSNKQLEMMTKFMAEFGLTPLSRSRLAIQVPTHPKPWERDEFFDDDDTFWRSPGTEPVRLASPPPPS